MFVPNISLLSPLAFAGTVLWAPDAAVSSITAGDDAPAAELEDPGGADSPSITGTFGASGTFGFIRLFVTTSIE